MITTTSLASFNQMISKEEIVLSYFSHDKCSVCKVLLPKIEQLLSEEFPKAILNYCNMEINTEIAAHNSVFTAPTIIIYVQGKEYKRYSRNLSLMVLKEDLARPYHLLY